MLVIEPPELLSIVPPAVSPLLKVPELDIEPSLVNVLLLVIVSALIIVENAVLVRDPVVAVIVMSPEPPLLLMSPLLGSVPSPLTRAPLIVIVPVLVIVFKLVRV